MMEEMETMTLDDFEERALAYGGDLDRWPEAERAAARAALAASPRAVEALAEARALDDMLDLWDGPEPSHALLGRVLADAATVAQESAAAAPAEAAPVRRAGWRERLFGGGPVFRPGLALAACLALGMAFGANIDGSVLEPAAPERTAQGIDVIDFAFAMEDDSDLLLGPEVLL